MQVVFVGTIAFLWLGACLGAVVNKNYNDAILYLGFVIAQIGMILNAIH